MTDTPNNPNSNTNVKSSIDRVDDLERHRSELEREANLQKSLTQKTKDKFDEDLKRPSNLETGANSTIYAKKLVNGDNFYHLLRKANAAYMAEVNLGNAQFQQI